MKDKTTEQKIDEIWKQIFDQPELGKKGRGIITRLDNIESDIETMKKRGVRLRWFWNGVSATTGGAAYAGVKSGWFAKLIGALFGIGAGDKMIK